MSLLATIVSFSALRNAYLLRKYFNLFFTRFSRKSFVGKQIKENKSYKAKNLLTCNGKICYFVRRNCKGC